MVWGVVVGKPTEKNEDAAAINKSVDFTKLNIEGNRVYGSDGNLVSFDTKEQADQFVIDMTKWMPWWSYHSKEFEP